MKHVFHFRKLRRCHGRNQVQAPSQAARLPELVGARIGITEALSGLRIAIVGCGSVGGRIACHLVRCGVRELRLIDPKKYRPESLLTHECDVHAVGRDKAVVTGKLCLRIRNDVDIWVGVGGIQDLPLAVLAGMDMVVLATDNLPAERETGQRCMWLGKTLVHGALHGDTLTAVVRFFSNASGQGPCPACLYGPREWLEHDSNARRYSCDGTLLDASVEGAGIQPTRSLSYLCSLTADLVVNQIVRHVIGLGQPVADTMIEYNGYTNRTVISRLKANTACRCEHLRYTPLQSRKSLAECSIRELVGMATAIVDSSDLLFAVRGMEWIEQAVCNCGLVSHPKAFVRIGEPAVAVCRGCRQAMQRHPLHARLSVATASLGTAVDLPLRRLGARSADCVVIRDTSRGWMILPPEPKD